MSDAERDVLAAHRVHLQGLMAAGPWLVLAGPTPGVTDTGIAVLVEVPDQVAAREIMSRDPVIASGVCAGELREMRVSLIRGRD